MDIKPIRDHLSIARLALGSPDPSDPLCPIVARLKAAERNLTPGDPKWHGDAVLIQTELEDILSELEKVPKSTSPRVVSGTEGITQGSEPKFFPRIDEAIKQIADAIELL